MNPEVKQLWVNALRSGDYPQARLALRSNTGYCCLGVLTDLAVKAGVCKWETNQSDYFGIAVGNQIESTSLPTPVQEWSGLGDSNPYIKGKSGERDSLDAMSANDEDRLSFNQIADLIDKNL